jgi:outer membrane receptor for ferrienterochelin and colicin
VTANDLEVNAILRVTLSSEISVTTKATFSNLADIENSAENLVGIAQSASQGAITAGQLETRPLMRTGEVLETVPGVIVTQHSGSGKANQYFLRGFNLDHGTDFAQTIAGMPVNLPTQAHGQGYSDINFMIPELVSGVQFSKGPYYADQGDYRDCWCIKYQLRHDIRAADSEPSGWRRRVRALIACAFKAGGFRIHTRGVGGSP